ncbi:MAG: hypothetical protein RBS73_16105 [Prolixibacteraceae bacterium]|jgi:poly(3-hydroxyalkanoate) synthetase|nr:hypothetical protein [Prolixibacteraceae bacterium]
MKKAIILSAIILLIALSGLENKSIASNKSSFKYAVLVQEKDPLLDIEKWMIDESFWKSPEKWSVQIVEDKENELKLENWMVQGKYWE